MENNSREARILETAKRIMQLPPEMQQAFVWLLENFDFVEKWTKMEVIPEDQLQRMIERAVTKKDHLMFLLLSWQQRSQQNQNKEESFMEITKSVVVSVVGRPNVGKSTLTNKLVGRKIAIVSNKPQTTRTRITGILNQDGCQYVFLDTPGLHKPRSRLGDYMVKVVTDTVAEVDVAMLVVEPIPNVGAPEETLIKQLKDSGIPGILVINKTDTVKKEELLAVIAAYAGKFDWAAVIPASAKHSDNLDVILSELDKFSLEGPQLFPDDMVSDQPERQMVAEVIREKMLRLLDREVPHGVAVGVESMEYTGNGVCRIHATIYCEKASHKGIIIGKGGEMLKKIGQYARADLEQDLECKVFLDLWIKVKEGWRNNQFQMRNFGYQDE